MRDISQIMDKLTEEKIRSERIKRLRVKTKLSRTEFCRRYGIPLPTLKSWEYGGVKAMQSSGISAFVNGLNKEGVPCTLDYLLNGEMEATESVTSINFAGEIKQFQQAHRNAVSFVVNDDSMAPYLPLNTLVLGTPVDLLSPQNYLHRLCILHYKSGLVKVRVLTPTSQANHFILTATNPTSSNPELLQLNELLLIATVSKIIFPEL